MGRQLESRACNHTTDNDDIEKHMNLFYETYLIKTTTKKYSLLLTNEGEKTEKRLKNTENSQNTLLSRQLLRKRQSS